jgi:hypothetical protein
MEKESNQTDATAEMLDRWCSAPGFQFTCPEAEEAYKKRAKRIADVIQLKVPDRVPIVPAFGMFPYLDNGFTCQEVFFDPQKAREAWLKTATEFEPDAFSSTLLNGTFFEEIGYRQLRLPGRGVPATSIFQFVEEEYVKAEEFYDSFLNDPSDFLWRVYLPRVCGMLEPLAKFPPLNQSFGYYLGLTSTLSAFGKPEIAGAFEALCKSAAHAVQWNEAVAATSREIGSLGFPSAMGGGTHAPFDTIGDFLRGTRGIMLDIRRNPDKLLQAMEKLVPIHIEIGLRAKQSGNPVVSIPLHKGAEGFMSAEQYKTFYWPTLRKVIMGLINEGLVPRLFFEGENTSRLEIIKDIPKGRAIYWFEKVDLHRAKEVLGDTVCFKGNVPVSLLAVGSPEDVKAYVKNLIDIVGKGGGLIVDCGALFDEARHENVKAMVDTTKEYGVYG